jgi:hypothetical protein
MHRREPRSRNRAAVGARCRPRAPSTLRYGLWSQLHSVMDCTIGWPTFAAAIVRAALHPDIRSKIATVPPSIVSPRGSFAGGYALKSAAVVENPGWGNSAERRVGGLWPSRPQSADTARRRQLAIFAAWAAEPVECLSQVGGHSTASFWSVGGRRGEGRSDRAQVRGAAETAVSRLTRRESPVTNDGRARASTPPKPAGRHTTAGCASVRSAHPRHPTQDHGRAAP